MLIMKIADIQKSTLAKLRDQNYFEDRGQTDHTPEFRKRPLSMWKTGLGFNYVTPAQPKNAVGLVCRDSKFTLSTNPLYKPGIPYAYPLYKINI